MTFLPIAVRELIVAARRPMTFRIRLGMVILASLTATMILLFGAEIVGLQGVGGAMFQVMSLQVMALQRLGA